MAFSVVCEGCGERVLIGESHCTQCGLELAESGRAVLARRAEELAEHAEGVAHSVDAATSGDHTRAHFGRWLLLLLGAIQGGQGWVDHLQAQALRDHWLGKIAGRSADQLFIDDAGNQWVVGVLRDHAETYPIRVLFEGWVLALVLLGLFRWSGRAPIAAVLAACLITLHGFVGHVLTPGANLWTLGLGCFSIVALGGAYRSGLREAVARRGKKQPKKKGAQVALECIECRRSNPETARFCAGCGARLADRAPVSRKKVLGKRAREAEPVWRLGLRPNRVASLHLALKLGLTLVGFTVLEAVARRWPEPFPGFLEPTQLAQALGVAVVVVLAATSRTRATATKLDVSPRGSLVPIAVMIGVVVVGHYYGRWLSLLHLDQLAQSAAQGPVQDLWIPGLLACAAVIAWEYAFRGVVLGQVDRVLPRAHAIWFVALLSVPWVSPGLALSNLGWAAALGWLRFRIGHWWPGMLLSLVVVIATLLQSKPG